MVIKMDCIFCKIVAGEIPSYTIYENEYVKCFLDINPISTGHTLIIPKKHFKDVFDIDFEYMNEINKAAKEILNLLNNKLKPQGFKLIQNNGNIQEVKHFHLHIIPSYVKNNKKSVEEVFSLLTK
jgi:histidine triad (HIT) family protein